MSKVCRNDVYVRDEKGPDWFQDFLRILAGEKTQTENILEAINNKRGETVESVVNKYRQAVGLDNLKANEDTEIAKTASVRPLSVRHAQMLNDDQENKSVILIIEKDPKVKSDLESLLENSSGTKNTHAILNFLKGALGNDVVSYSDDDLVGYIENMKKKYTNSLQDEKSNIGGIGAEDNGEYDDQVADFVEHGKHI